MITINDFSSVNSLLDTAKEKDPEFKKRNCNNIVESLNELDLENLDKSQIKQASRTSSKRVI